MHNCCWRQGVRQGTGALPATLLHHRSSHAHSMLLQGGESRFMRAMGSGYARFTFIVVATLLSIHALDLQMTPDADPAHSAATTAKFFTGGSMLRSMSKICKA